MKFLWKKIIWKRIGLSLLSLILITGLIFGYFWLTYVYIPTTKEVVQFNSQEITLIGTLYYPEDSKETYPAVILLHGSEKDTPDGMGWLTLVKAYVKKGFVVLAYDKRGTGKSGGTFKRQDFKNLIKDIYNAVDFLKENSKIKPDAIGLMTTSQSGFFAPQIALEHPDIAFIYNRVGPVVDWTSVSVYQTGIRIGKQYDNPKAVEEIMKIYKDIITFFIKANGNLNSDDQTKEELDKRMAASWKKYGTGLPYGKKVPSSYTEAAMHRIAYSRAYDPRLYFEKNFTTPLFYSFGALDVNIPTNASVDALKKIMQRKTHNIQYKVYPNVDHSMAKITYIFSGFWSPGFLEEMASWSKAKIDQKLKG